MKMNKAFLWLITASLALLLCGCGETPSYLQEMSFTQPEILSGVSVSKGQEGEKLYAQTDELSLYVDEQKATFSVTDKAGNRWSSVPAGTADDAAADELLGLIQVHYADQMGNTYELNSMTHSVRPGKAEVMQLSNGVRFEFSFPEYGFKVPVHVTLCKDGVELSVIFAQIQEENALFRLTSVDVAPYFHAAEITEDGFVFLPDGSGTILDWKNVIDPSIEYRQFVYGRDAAIVALEKTADTQPIRLPVFGILRGNSAYTAIITEGAPRAAINATAAGKRNQYSNAYAEFIYRESALVKIEKKNQTVTIIEQSHTTLGQMTVRYCLTAGKELSYTDMAQAYRNYLLHDGGLTVTAGERGAPLVIELYGGVLKQQFVMGFPVEQVVPLTTFDDAQTIIRQLQQKGVDSILINYTQWQEDATGAGIQTEIRPEGKLGGERGLQALIDLCKEQGISIYLNANVNSMFSDTWGYSTKNDAASSVRRDPAMQYHYNISTGQADVSTPSFLLKVTRILETAQKLANSAEKYDITGLSDGYLGQQIYSDFSKNAITRDHSEYFWKDTLSTLASEGRMPVTGGNAYALGAADLILDAPMTDSGFLMTARAIPFYQIALHGVVDLSVTAINEQSDVTAAFLKAVETGSCLKWRWIAENADELVDTDYNAIVSSQYNNWIDLASEQYQQAAQLLTRIAACTVESHELLIQYGEVVRVVWSDGTQVLVNYNDTAVSVDGLTVQAQSFAVKEGAK